MAKRDLLLLIVPMMKEMAKLYPPVQLMINYDGLHDAYIIRAWVPGDITEAIEFVYMHEIENGSLLPVVVNLFYERALSAIRVVVHERHTMHGADEYDEIVQAREIMDDLSRGG